MVEEIVAEVSPKSIGGVPLFTASGRITSENVGGFASETAIIEQTSKKLQDLGFKILYKGRITITVSGPRDLFEDVFKTTLRSKVTNLFAGMPGIEKMAPFFEGPAGKKLFGAPSGLENLIDGVALPEPPIFFESPLPPVVRYFHLDVPSDVALRMKADTVQKFRVTGKGIKVAMPDTGFYRHPFYSSRHYRAQVVLSPDATGPNVDDYGHGTGEAANIFATAPDVNLIAVKMGADSTLAFNTAVDQNPDVITCSWGYDLRDEVTGLPLTTLPTNHAPLEAAVADAVARGIIVCFSAGNGHIAFPAMHPDVIAVGGVYCDQKGNLQASNYASSFQSQIYSGRNVPDVCGLVGMQPNAIYIMLPQQAGSSIDTSFAGGTFPTRDETASDDGWAVFSGTSAASPQVAGVCALLLKVCRRLSPHSIKTILQRSATDVTTGQTNPSADGAKSAGVGPDLATGYGLVNATAACLRAYLRCAITWPPRKPRAIPKISKKLEEEVENLETTLLSELKE